MCLHGAVFSGLNNIDSMEAIQSENHNNGPLKDCRVVLVPLQNDIARRKTVRVQTVGDFVFATSDSSNLDLLIIDNRVINEDCKASLPISVYSKIDRNGIITEVWCNTFRKRKLEDRKETEDYDEIVNDVMKCVLDRVSSESIKTQSIDFTSPGVKEIELIEDFCRENGYRSEDYRDLEQLFSFRTLPAVEVTAKLFKTGNKRRKVQNNKVSIANKDEIPQVKEVDEDDDEISKTISSNDLSNSGLEKIENLKIRKILEDFGRLSRSQGSSHAPRQKKLRADSPSLKDKNESYNKPLNLCKKDNPDKTTPIKLSKSVQADISISGSILRTLLHSQECTENWTKDKSKEPADRCAPQQTQSENIQKKITTKRSTAQQTDPGSFHDEKPSETQSSKNDKWLNDPTAILKKIEKLKKDILYLDLLAEEKEKERIAILCFKNYKESILKKIFASDMSEDGSDAPQAQRNTKESPSLTIPKLIHPPCNSVGSVNSLMGQRPLNAGSILFPSSVPLLERQTSCSTLPENLSIRINPINENFTRLRNCVKCDLLKANLLNTKYRNPWYCNPLCQTHSCTQHAKGCRGIVEETSSSN